MHLRNRALHHLYRAGRAGHDTGPKGSEIEARKLWMVELRDEHRRHPMQCRAAFLGNGLQRGQRVKPLARKHHAGAMGERSKIAKHHAKAVIERHGNA